jgi:hypothetical protein
MLESIRGRIQAVEPGMVTPRPSRVLPDCGPLTNRAIANKDHAVATRGIGSRCTNPRRYADVLGEPRKTTRRVQPRHRQHGSLDDTTGSGSTTAGSLSLPGETPGRTL